MIVRRFRLVALIYALHLALVLLVVFPLYSVIVENVGVTGFGRDLVQGFDLLLWREILLDNRDAFIQVLLRALMVIPVFWVWKTATQMGVIYALHNGAIWPFWPGVYYHTVRGVVLGVFFLLFKVAWAVSVYMGVVFLQKSFFGGEIGSFWLIAVVLPTALLAGLAIIDLYQRYSRIALVVRNEQVPGAIRAGFNWPSRFPVISLVYVIWYVIAAGVFVAGLLLNARLHVGISFFLLAVVLQQVVLLARSAVTVGWVGSEVHLFERLGNKKASTT